MNPIPRRIGWLLMALALGIAVAARQFGVTYYGPLPALVVVLLVGGIGVMLVFTDMMVRGLYVQVGAAAKASEAAGAGDAAVGGDGDDVAIGGDFDGA
jgi:hypothetical protein